MDWALTGALIGLIIASCHLLDWLVSKKEEDKQKVAIIKWWSQLDDFNYGQAVRNANIACNKIFDKIYGKRHFSLKCFKLSCCTSFLVVTALMIVNVASTKNVGFLGHPFFFMIFTLVCPIFLNIWIDYLSLIETRYILRFASRVRPLMLPVLLTADLLVSAAIYLLLVTVLSCVFFLVHRIAGNTWSPLFLLGFFADYYTFIWHSDADKNISTVWFYSTFSTSVIFYIFCVSTLFFKFVRLSKTRIMVILEKLEDSDHLFKALGGFLSAVLLFVKCVVEVIQHVVQA
jgi:hypothetical protein